MTQSDSVPPIDLSRFACFFDVDGCLAAIETRPDWVSIPENVRLALCQLYLLTGGALALVSGRTLNELDALSAPLHSPAAGVHGAVRRDAQGHIHQIDLPPSLAATLGQELREAIAPFTGCHVEAKGMAFALHYREAAHHKADIEAVAAAFSARYPELTRQPGKCVVELKPAGVNKGAAIEAFMTEAPFSGRTPLFIGDDVTDEAGFNAVNDLGGVSIKVGPGETAAGYRLDDVGQVHAWLLSLLEQKENHTMNTNNSVREGL
ncbi:trehalose-phosphatase [Biostraticola tofi]|uniref:Trehalose 6-phosphate phosphatase n=1 Tax=Biostraticola tofi TaxID=466109 RepID=A0A4R3Z4G0_9GAMM|nr:trehalose-phosphatase [Biostraticola tofi]TCW00063.1 trehalose 6-phosphatase [Biostraticola tofi]